MKKEEFSINYKFVPAGTIAPENLNKNEIWVDVGSRAAPQVLDHHGGDIHTWSASELIIEKYDKYILNAIDHKNDIRIITHEKPDIDAICSVWLVEKLIRENIKLENDKFISEIVNIVSANDQGIILDDELNENWIIIFKLLLTKEYKDLDDEQKLKKGLIIFDKTYLMLKNGISLQEIAEKLSSPYINNILISEKKNYIKDLSMAVKFPIKLPLRHIEKKLRLIRKKPYKTPDRNNNEWSKTDGLFVVEPTSSLFKEFARNDRKNSTADSGFSFLCIAYDIDIKDDHKNKLINKSPKRYIISTDPSSGFHLEGLGTILEILEQEKEDRSKKTLLPGRERVSPEKGRFGFNVRSPWYDGRGHNFTIVDSPMINLQSEKGLFFSQLTTEEVMKAVKNYGVI